MSRIDQALTRALGAQPDRERPDPFQLGDYATEHPGRLDAAAEPGPRPFARHEAVRLVAVPPSSPGGGAPVSPDAYVPGAALAQVRRVCALLDERRRTQGVRSIVVSSPDETREKSAIVVGLGAALASLYGTRVLVIDAEMRAPFVHEIVGVRNAAGFTDALAGDRRDAAVTTISPLVHLVTIGSRGASEESMLASAGLLADTAQQYDVVLLNAPAVSLLAEPRVMARQAHGAVLVVGASTPFPRVEAAMAALGREHVIATILLGLA